MLQTLRSPARSILARTFKQVFQTGLIIIAFLRIFPPARQARAATIIRTALRGLRRRAYANSSSRRSRWGAALMNGSFIRVLLCTRISRSWFITDGDVRLMI